jgi:hypothetical protein
LAYHYLVQGNTGVALEQLKKVASLEPDDSLAPRLIRQLEALRPSAFAVATHRGWAHAWRASVWSAKLEYAKALTDFEEAIRHDSEYALAYNNHGWLLATCPVSDFRDANKAVERATKACELTGWKNALYIDTLAAARAENDQWTEAVEMQQRAITMLKSAPEQKGFEDQFLKRLEFYKRKEPYREVPMPFGSTERPEKREPRGGGDSIARGQAGAPFNGGDFKAGDHPESLLPPPAPSSVTVTSWPPPQVLAPSSIDRVPGSPTFPLPGQQPNPTGGLPVPMNSRRIAPIGPSNGADELNQPRDPSTQRLSQSADELIEQATDLRRAFEPTVAIVTEGRWFLRDMRQLEATATAFRRSLSSGVSNAEVLRAWEQTNAHWLELENRTSRIARGRTGPNIQRVRRMARTVSDIRKFLGELRSTAQ